MRDAVNQILTFRTASLQHVWDHVLAVVSWQCVTFFIVLSKNLYLMHLWNHGWNSSYPLHISLRAAVTGTRCYDFTLQVNLFCFFLVYLLVYFFLCVSVWSVNETLAENWNMPKEHCFWGFTSRLVFCEWVERLIKLFFFFFWVRFIISCVTDCVTIVWN